MFDKSIMGNLEKRNFDELEKNKLGKYIYALRDPRDGKIFYIGQGAGDRLFDHFKEAEKCLRKNLISSSKVIRILDIWKNEEDVDWIIISHNIDESMADFIEAAALDALSQSQNGIPLNDVSPPKSSILLKEDIKLFGAKPVNPEVSIKRVFLFSIHNGLADGKQPYDATRSAWYVKSAYQKLPAFAVGIKNGISVGSFSIAEWADIGKKHEFNGSEYTSLLNLNWSKIISRAKGFWQRGNYLIVKFDGNGRFSIDRGAGAEQRDQWFNCID